MAVVEVRGRVMASVLHVIAIPAPNDGATGQLDGPVRDVISYLDHLERCWSRFIATSDISRINRLGSSGGGRISVDRSTLLLLASMVEGYECTAGRFDPTVLRAVIAEGYTASRLDPAIVTTMPHASRHRGPSPRSTTWRSIRRRTPWWSLQGSLSTPEGSARGLQPISLSHASWLPAPRERSSRSVATWQWPGSRSTKPVGW